MRLKRVSAAAAVAATSIATAITAGGVLAQERNPLASLRAGDVFTHCEIFCPEMTMLRGGVFKMGSRPGEYGREADEGPVRDIRVRPFAIANTETSFNQWDACVADGFCRKVEEDFGWGRGRGRRPVIGVSWRDIVGVPVYAEDDEDRRNPLPPEDGFLPWLNSKVEGRPYRLPTEAEWEYAARAGTDAAHFTGDRISADQANFNPKPMIGRSTDGPYRGMTVGVGDLPSNPWGLFETAGNVWEWVQDCYRPSYDVSVDTAVAYEEPDCQERVLRGGGYQAYEIGVRSANRYSFDPNAGLGAFGFRVVFDLQTAGLDCDDKLLRCRANR